MARAAGDYSANVLERAPVGAALEELVLYPGVRAGKKWHEFAERAGWEDDPGGLWEMMFMRYIEFLVDGIK